MKHNHEEADDDDGPLLTPVLSFNDADEQDDADDLPSNWSRLGLDDPEDEEEEESPDAGVLGTPVLNWAEIREEERQERERTLNNRRDQSQVEEGQHMQADDPELLIPPRMVW